MERSDEREVLGLESESIYNLLGRREVILKSGLLFFWWRQFNFFFQKKTSILFPEFLVREKPEKLGNPGESKKAKQSLDDFCCFLLQSAPDPPGPPRSAFWDRQEKKNCGDDVMIMMIIII